MTYLDFLRAGSALHRVVTGDAGFSIVPASEDPAAREAFQAVAEVAVEREGEGYRVEDVSMSEDAGGYDQVWIVPTSTSLQT